jgi:hypothetical protein
MGSSVTRDWQSVPLTVSSQEGRLLIVWEAKAGVKKRLEVWELGRLEFLQGQVRADPKCLVPGAVRLPNYQIVESPDDQAVFLIL